MEPAWEKIQGLKFQLSSYKDMTGTSPLSTLIRALTGGDITKETAIMKMDTWRALTELDAKAREAEELRKATKKP